MRQQTLSPKPAAQPLPPRSEPGPASSQPSPQNPAGPAGRADPENASAEAEPAGFVARHRRPILIGLGLLLALIIGWKGTDWWTTGRFDVSTDNAYVRADITLVAPKVQGYVEDVAVSDNQAVKAGDLLIRLEGADAAARMEEARAALAAAEAEAARARAQLASLKSTAAGAAASLAAENDRLSELNAGAEAANANARLAKDELARDEQLAERGFYPKAGLDTAAAKADAANASADQAGAAIVSQKSRISVARTSLARAQEDIGAAEAAIASADAQVAAAKARVEAAALDSGRFDIRAPVDGIVTNRTVARGQLVNPGQQTMAIVPTQSAYVIANFKETQLGRMQPGQPVELHIDAYPDMKVHGTVESLAPASGGQFSLIPMDTATGNFTKIVQRVPVRIAISQDALATGLMRPGLSVEATVSVKPAKS
ncbi:multidrug resistance efflux protein [Hyphomonas polymorpha PS728]|uniref:Multidrug resistance efflux protein n=1 Tax=Hyphomonas polymorpha PS728 TaxID=1280954 RepID=A0A062VDI8_9PROT|nr:HlyD family secretion protein [Hyphomonas polymorpha]KDA00590.1 multidrug resistance efflux protein [Hyphomonas polymorpha PS728]